MKKLNEMNKKELSALALEKGITLSYKDIDGKRKRYTMQQLIEMIEKTFEVETVETEVAPDTKQDQKVYTLKTVLNELKNISDLITLTTFKKEVQNYFMAIDKTLKKKSLKKRIAIELNKINYVLKMKELKL